MMRTRTRLVRLALGVRVGVLRLGVRLKMCFRVKIAIKDRTGVWVRFRASVRVLLLTYVSVWA